MPTEIQGLFFLYVSWLESNHIVCVRETDCVIVDDLFCHLYLHLGNPKVCFCHTQKQKAKHVFWCMAPSPYTPHLKSMHIHHRSSDFLGWTPILHFGIVSFESWSYFVICHQLIIFGVVSKRPSLQGNNRKMNTKLFGCLVF